MTPPISSPPIPRSQQQLEFANAAVKNCTKEAVEILLRQAVEPDLDEIVEILVWKRNDISQETIDDAFLRSVQKGNQCARVLANCGRVTPRLLSKHPEFCQAPCLLPALPNEIWLKHFAPHLPVEALGNLSTAIPQSQRDRFWEDPTQQPPLARPQNTTAFSPDFIIRTRLAMQNIPIKEMRRIYHRAVLGHNWDLVKTMLRGNTQFLDQGLIIRTLHESARNGENECLKLLFPFTNDIPSAAFDTALGHASAHGHWPCVKRLLLEQEHRLTSGGVTQALHDACVHGQANCIRLILHIRTVNSYDMRIALERAVASNRPESIRAILNAPGIRVEGLLWSRVESSHIGLALWNSVLSNRPECVKAILESNETFSKERIKDALNLSVSYDHPASTQVILDVLGDKISPGTLTSAFDQAAWARRQKCSTLILRAMQPGTVNSVLWNAAFYGLSLVMKTILDSGIEFPEGSRETALRCAESKNHADCVALLKEKS